MFGDDGDPVLQGVCHFRRIIEGAAVYRVGEVKVVRSVHELLDAEAVRVIKTLPKFSPGHLNGQAVSMWYTLPVTFKLQDKKESESTEKF